MVRLSVPQRRRARFDVEHGKRADGAVLSADERNPDAEPDAGRAGDEGAPGEAPVRARVGHDERARDGFHGVGVEGGRARRVPGAEADQALGQHPAAAAGRLVVEDD